MDLTELNVIRFVTGSKPKIDPRVLIAQNINEWIYNHVILNVEELLINMPAKEYISETKSNETNNNTQTENNNNEKVEKEEEEGLNKQILDELFTSTTGLKEDNILLHFILYYVLYKPQPQKC